MDLGFVPKKSEARQEIVDGMPGSASGWLRDTLKCEGQVIQSPKEFTSRLQQATATGNMERAMKAIQNIPMHDDIENLTIPEAEEMIEEALEELSFSTDPELARALRFLAPPGYQAIVELCGENGRSKRRNANATNWTPEEDEIRIYFERVDGEDEDDEEPSRGDIGNGRSVLQGRGRGPRSVSGSVSAYENGNVVNGNVSNGNVDDSVGQLPPDIDERIKDLCATLAEAERGGHAFIALKWFRDSFLPRKSFHWNQSPESRQMILAEAILRGVVLTSKIPNPKTPAYPTTTIRLNRAEAGVPEEAQRFRPVAVHGDIGNLMLDDERGNL
jgi:hypothetical protein